MGAGERVANQRHVKILVRMDVGSRSQSAAGAECSEGFHPLCRFAPRGASRTVKRRVETHVFSGWSLRRLPHYSGDDEWKSARQRVGLIFLAHPAFLF